MLSVTVLRVLLVTLAAAAAAPATASGHAAIAMDGDTIVYVARDATSRSTLTVTVGSDSIRVSDPTIDGGIAPGRCEPREFDRNGFVVEATCPRTEATALRVDVGALDDAVEVREAGGATPVSTLVLAGSGADRVSGGAGADTIDGGPGRDDLQGGAGDDELRSRDGSFEVVACGAGEDRAYLDVPDVADGCEAVEHTDPPAPPPSGDEPPPPGAADTTRPVIDASAPRRQTLRSGAVKAFAATDEPATVAATATVRVGRRRLRLVASQERVAAAGNRVRLILRASPAATRRLRRAVRRRRVHAVITVTAIDDAGNSAARRLPRVRLRR